MTNLQIQDVRLGPVLARLGGLLGRLWPILGSSWRTLGRLGRILARLGAILGHLGHHLGLPKASQDRSKRPPRHLPRRGRSQTHLGSARNAKNLENVMPGAPLWLAKPPRLDQLGGLLRRLLRVLAHLGASWVRLGASWVRLDAS